MVFNTSDKFEGKEKKPREKVVGKLIGIRGDFSKMKIADPEKGIFDWLELAIVTGKDKQGSDIYRNITAYKVNFEKMAEFKKADDLLKDKKKPKVEVECYKVENLAKDKETGQPIMEEITENRNGKEVIIQRQKVWTNYRSSRDDIENTFKILVENFENEVETQPIGSEDKIVG